MIKEIKAKINQYNKIILLRHTNPDGDALGSTFGLGWFLKAHFPQKQILTDGINLNNYLSFLVPLPQAQPADYKGALIIVCDTANTRRIDSEHWSEGDYLIKIDHHPDDEPYGDLSWVEPDVIAASSMIAELIRTYDLAVPNKAACALFTGIVLDSNRFLFAGTNAKVFGIVQYLVSYIKNLNGLYDKIYLKPLYLFDIKTKILNKFQISSQGVGYATFNERQINQLGVSNALIKAMVNLFSGIKEIKIWFIAVYNKDLHNIKVSIRSRNIDISHVASKYGGGGHARAAAGSLASWDQLPQFINDLETLLKIG